MADISGRRDRNKKSPAVHYDMHRCTRRCDLHCFAAERSRLIGPAWKNCVHPAELRAPTPNFSPFRTRPRIEYLTRISLGLGFFWKINYGGEMKYGHIYLYEIRKRGIYRLELE